MAATGQGRASARVNVAGRGETNVATGLPVLDHLLTLLAVYASFDLALEVEPGSPEVEITAAARFLDELAQTARLTLHVRLVEGKETQHVLEAIFKALGVALAQACRPRKREAR